MENIRLANCNDDRSLQAEEKEDTDPLESFGGQQQR